MYHGTAINSQWMIDIMDVCKDHIYKAYRATGEVTKYDPSKRNYGQGEKE
jgi:hypothetical protein